MLTKVVHIEKRPGLCLAVSFNDGSAGVHDFSVFLANVGPMGQPLRDETYFAQAFLDFGAPTWPNGFDMAPEWLRREMAAAGELDHAAAE